MSRPPLLPRVDEIRSLPVVMLEVFDGCGCRCRMCDLWRPDRKGGAQEGLDLDLLESWLPGWRALGVGRVGLTGGDPLLHGKVDLILEMLGDAGFRLTLMTAGTGLEHHAEAVARWCDSVVVSLDGPSEVHDAVRRVPGAFAELQIGVSALRRRAETPVRITARCTVQRANIGHLMGTVEAAREMKLDGISFLPVDTSSTAFGRTGDLDADRLRRELCPDRNGIENLATELEAITGGSGSDGAPGFVAEDRQALVERVLDHFRAEAGLTTHRARPCNAPWVSAVVGSDGMVRPCFFHPASGNVGRGVELGAVLNADRAREQRNRFDVVNDPICRRCVCPLALRLGEDPR